MTTCTHTPLHYAAIHGRLEICKFIIQSGEDITLRNDVGDTPFHVAAEAGHLEICELFLENLEHKSPRNEERRTPLMLAKEFGHSAVVELIRNYLGSNFMFLIFSQSTHIFSHE